MLPFKILYASLSFIHVLSICCCSVFSLLYFLVFPTQHTHTDAHFQRISHAYKRQIGNFDNRPPSSSLISIIESLDLFTCASGIRCAPCGSRWCTFLVEPSPSLFLCVCQSRVVPAMFSTMKVTLSVATQLSMRPANLPTCSLSTTAKAVSAK